jgi:hypothetical protein
VEASSFKFVRSDIVLEALSQVHGQFSVPIFNMGPAARGSLPSLGAASAEQRIERFEIALPPREARPTSAKRYWLTLTGARQGWQGHLIYNGTVIDGLVSSYKSLLWQMATDRQARLSSVTWSA